MNTKIKEMRELVEVSGGCWHEDIGMQDKEYGKFYCPKCEIERKSFYEICNPSPSDIQALFNIARSMNIALEIDVNGVGNSQVSAHVDNNLSHHPAGQSIDGLQIADALRKALFQAIKGE